jgi:hypothetical protein
MDTTLHEALTYYAAHSSITDPGVHRALFDDLPRDLPTLHQIVQNIYIHVWKIRKYHPGWLKGRTHEIESRTVEKSLSRVLEHDTRPLTEVRPKEKKLIIDCRHFAVLLVAMLRHQGIPARARCGFATYLEKSHYQDHWVCEYWNADQGRWILEDPDLVKHDVSRDEFITGGKAWQLVRSGQMSDLQFGFAPDMLGMWAVRFDLVRDFASLNGFECLSGDSWGIIDKPEPTITGRDLKLLDEAAAWSLSDDGQFEAMRAFYESHDAFRVPRIIHTYNYVADKNLEVNLDERG